MSIELINKFWRLPKKNSGNSGYWLTLICLCDFANKDTNIAFPSIKTIASRTGLSEKQTRRHTHQLEKDGLIFIQKNRYGGRSGMTCEYRVNLADTPLPPMGVENNFNRVVKGEMGSRKGYERAPLSESQTTNKPSLTIRYFNKKYGSDWRYDPNLTYRVGLELGVQANAGESNGGYVDRLMMLIRV